MSEVISPLPFTFCPLCMENSLEFVEEEEDDFTQSVAKVYECTKCHLRIYDWYYHHQTRFDLPKDKGFDVSLYPGTEIIDKE